MLKQKEKVDVTVGQIVRDDYRTADVFKKWGINYCCGGDMPLGEACKKQKVERRQLEDELDTAMKTVTMSNDIRFDAWPVDFLVDYIIYLHHSYVKKAIPALKTALHEFVDGHRSKYKGLDKLQEIFGDLACELEEHIIDEEVRIFPYLKQIYHAYNRRETYGKLFVRTLGKPLSTVVDSDHRRIGALLNELRKATDNYQYPQDACTEYQVIYKKFREFDQDLVRHKHLENNILIPKVQEMEKQLLQIS